MRGPSLCGFLALLAFLIPHPTSGQPTGTWSSSRAVEEYFRGPNHWLVELVATGGSREWENLQIDKQFGEFLDTLNGVPLPPRTIDNTDTARQELTYTLTSPFFTVGGNAQVSLGHGFSGGGGGSIYIGTLELGVVDLQQSEVTYDHSTEPIGYRVHGQLSFMSFVHPKRHIMLITTGQYDYTSLDAESLTRTPAQTAAGGSVTTTNYRDFNTTHRSSATFEWWMTSYKSLARVRPRARIGYLSMNTRLTSLVSVNYAQTLAGLTSEFTGQTDLSKDGVYGTVGASFAITHGFNATADYSFGAEKGFTFGGTYRFSVRK